MSNKTYWITKYALTKGIFPVQGVVFGEKRNMLAQTGVRFQTFFHNNEFHDNFEDARARAMDMQQKKIASLQKQLDKITSLDF